MVAQLGRVHSVDLREAWRDEAREFTPWLLENAELLAEALGIELEVTDSERGVGKFSCDLVGRDITNDAILIVENQLEQTDHSHLGQLLTYAAGTDAVTIVWIAWSFQEEHRQAVDWLNERTDEQTHFFGVEIGLIQIGDQPTRAPLFRVVAQPNDWQKQVRAATRGGAATGLGVGDHWTVLCSGFSAVQLESTWGLNLGGALAVAEQWMRR